MIEAYWGKRPSERRRWPYGVPAEAHTVPTFIGMFVVVDSALLAPSTPSINQSYSTL